MQGLAFELARSIGKGSTATVFEAKHPLTGQAFAVKRLNDCRGCPPSEAALLASLDHQNIVSMEGWYVCPDSGLHHIVLERCQTDLYQVLKESRAMEEGRVRRLAAQIWAALSYLHSEGVVYRDLKPQNVLLTEGGTVKLADFGLAARLYSPLEKLYSHRIQGTRQFMAPEMFSSRGYSTAVDVWALGVLLFQCLAGELPFHAEDPFTLQQLIVEEEPDWLLLERQNLSATCIDFVKGLLTKQPSERILKSRAHDWISSSQAQTSACSAERP